ncbi:MAG: hypothetical protein NW220_12650 [Leptolyngbyaceae cyanobacterium bins.349]|nr:hypothetical protein [Leptolyngbyaceae cyanobacterium bins.349]
MLLAITFGDSSSADHSAADHFLLQPHTLKFRKSQNFVDISLQNGTPQLISNVIATKATNIGICTVSGAKSADCAGDRQYERSRAHLA